MYSNHNEGKIAERYIRKLSNKIYKYMTSISKNMYIDKLDNIVMNTTIHITEQYKLDNIVMNTTIHITEQLK